MRRLRWIGVAMLLAAVGTAGWILARPPRPPAFALALRMVRVESVAIVDANGTDLWLAECLVQNTNRMSPTRRLDGWLFVEVVGPIRSQGPDPEFGQSFEPTALLAPGSQVSAEFLAPSGTETSEVTVRIAGLAKPSLRESIVFWVRRMEARFPRTAALVTRSLGYPRLRPSSHWKETVVMLTLPMEPATAAALDSAPILKGAPDPHERPQGSTSAR